MQNKFTLRIIPRPHQPRSKRLKAMAAAATAQSVVTATSGQTSQQQAESHKHPNLSTLNAITTQSASYTNIENEETPTRYLTLTTADSQGNAVVRKIAAEYADAAGELTPDSPTRRQFLSSEDDDTALGSITFQKLQHFIEGIVSEAIRSENFKEGFLGEGYALQICEDGKAALEIDRLTVRQLMTVFELIIQKIRAVAGQLVVSPANAKVKSVSFYSDDVTSRFSITTEEECPFLPGDLVRCQVFSGSRQKSYWVEVLSATSKSFTVDAASFEEWGCRPEEGDELVLLGSTTDSSRQAAISISAAADGKPRIDILSAISSTSLDRTLRARIGDLSGTADDWFPDDQQPSGHGIYSDNAFLRGSFILRNGTDVRTAFAVTEGKIQSAVSAVRQDFIENQGFLANPAFLRGAQSWQLQSDSALYAAGQTLIISQNAILAAQTTGAAITTDQNRPVLRIAATTVSQRNADMRQRPDIISDARGLKLPAFVQLAITLRVISEGTLQVFFDGESYEGFAPSAAFLFARKLSPSGDYTTVFYSAPWTATGDFTLSFTGEAYIRTILLTSDPVETFSKRYQTLFEQSSNLVRIAAAVYDHDEQMLKETGLLIRPEGAGLYMQDADGNLALIGITTEKTDSQGNTRSVIKLDADHIALEGLVTANSNFQILNDGSIVTRNAKIGGYIYTSFKPIAQSNAQDLGNGKYLLHSDLYVLSAGNHIVLPAGENYEGARVIITDIQFRDTRETTAPTTLTILPELLSTACFHAAFIGHENNYTAEKIEFKAGSVELVLASIPLDDKHTQYAWIILSHSCAYITSSSSSS